MTPIAADDRLKELSEIGKGLEAELRAALQYDSGPLRAVKKSWERYFGDFRECVLDDVAGIGKHLDESMKEVQTLAAQCQYLTARWHEQVDELTAELRNEHEKHERLAALRDENKQATKDLNEARQRLLQLDLRSLEDQKKNVDAAAWLKTLLYAKATTTIVEVGSDRNVRFGVIENKVNVVPVNFDPEDQDANWRIIMKQARLEDELINAVRSVDPDLEWNLASIEGNQGNENCEVNANFSTSLATPQVSLDGTSSISASKNHGLVGRSPSPRHRANRQSVML